MARKLCPSCNKLTGGSTKECSCGHVFAASSIVKPRTTKLCPKCKQELPRLLERCGCGYEFADIREARAFLEDRARVGWAYVAIGATVIFACTLVMIATSGAFLIGSVTGIILVVRGFITRSDARAQLRSIRIAKGVLPSAKVVETKT